MKLLFVLLLAYGVWASPGSSRNGASSGSSRNAGFPGSSRNEGSRGSSRSGGYSSSPGFPGSHYKEADVFWRNYDGRVPRDAIDASDESSDEFIFVGMGYLKNVGMLPGTLHPGDTSLQVTENGRTSTLNENVHILCSHRNLNVRWIEVNSADIACLRRIPGIKLVDGGVENGVKLFVGRHQHEGKMQVGKVYTKAPYEGLHIVNKNGGATTYKQFEILVSV